jgi:hypothetical protein
MWRNLKTGSPDQFNRPEDIARQKYLDLIESIAADTSLTQSAKGSLRAQAYQRTKDHIDGLAVEAAEARVHAAKKATRAAFGTGDLAAKSTRAEQVAIAAKHQSAIDRVSEIMEPAALSNLLKQADDIGNEVLARAVGRQAHAVGADDVLAAYIADRPQQGAAVNELRTTKDDAMNDNITGRFFTPPPSELGGQPNAYTVQRAIDADPNASAPAQFHHPGAAQVGAS